MSIYEQIYNGDKKNVGRIIGQGGYKITQFKNSLPINEGSILWMHWEASNNTWIVRGTTRNSVSKAMDWILSEEKRFHMLEYEKQQVQSLEMLEFKEIEVIRHPVNLERQHAGGWTNSSDNLNWRNQHEKEQDKSLKILGVEAARDPVNLERQHTTTNNSWNLDWVDELSPILDDTFKAFC